MIASRPGAHRAAVWAMVHAAVGIVFAVALTGCGPAGNGLQPDAGRQLQQRVLDVSQAAAADDHAGALQTLDGLATELAAAAGSGQVSAERRRTITTAITAVRADLTAALDAAQAAATAAAETAAAAAAVEDARAKADAEVAATAAQESSALVVPAPLPAQESGSGQGKAGAGKARSKNG